MLLLECLIGAAALAVLLPVLVLFAEVLAALIGREDRQLDGNSLVRPRVVVVIPAHNEAGGIRTTLQSLMPQLRQGDTALVVADNCSDETATIAAAEGAEVIIRQDSTHRGKGYALDFGMRHLERDPPEVVVILDADCRLEEGTIARLAHMCALRRQPVQGLNLSRAPLGAPVKVRIAEFASVLKNLVRPLGLRRLGLPCQLTGTGMAFPWSLISGMTLATGHIVEDLKLGIDLAAAGHPPIFCPLARVTSDFPATEEGFNTQRTRWEHGYLGVLLRDAPGVLAKSVARRDGRLLAMGLDLCVPPLALVSLLTVAVWSASAVLYAVVRAGVPFFMATAAAVLLGFSVLSSWARFGRQIVSLGTLGLAIAYAISKLPVYGRFLVARQLDWVRSRRDHDRSA